MIGGIYRDVMSTATRSDSVDERTLPAPPAPAIATNMMPPLPPNDATKLVGLPPPQTLKMRPAKTGTAAGGVRAVSETPAAPPAAPSTAGAVRPPLPPPMMSKMRTSNKEDKVVVEPRLVDSSPKLSLVQSTTERVACPVGHSRYSWLAGSSDKKVPVGHSSYSWNPKPDHPPQSHRTIKEKGNKLFKEKDFHAAARMYSKAIELSDGVPETERALLYLNQAAAYLNLQRYPEAAIAANNAVTLDDANPKAWYRLAKVLEAQGQMTDAFIAVKKGMETMVGTVQEIGGEADYSLRSLQKFAKSLQTKMVHSARRTTSKEVAKTETLNFGAQTDNLKKLNSSILKKPDLDEENVVPARQRPTEGISARPHEMRRTKDFPQWYCEFRGERPQFPEGFRLPDVCKPGTEQEDLQIVEGVEAMYKLEREKFAPCFLRLAALAHTIRPQDLSKCTNPFAPHNRKVFQRSAQNIACEYMATDKMQIVQQELDGLDPLAANLVVLAVFRSMSTLLT